MNAWRLQKKRFLVPRSRTYVMHAPQHYVKCTSAAQTRSTHPSDSCTLAGRASCVYTMGINTGTSFEASISREGGSIEVRCVNGHMNDATERETKNGSALRSAHGVEQQQNGLSTGKQVNTVSSRVIASFVQLYTASPRCKSLYSCTQHLHCSTT